MIETNRLALKTINLQSHLSPKVLIHINKDRWPMEKAVMFNMGEIKVEAPSNGSLSRQKQCLPSCPGSRALYPRFLKGYHVIFYTVQTKIIVKTKINQTHFNT